MSKFQTIVAVVIVVWIAMPSLAEQKNYFELEEVHMTAGILLQLQDADGAVLGWGTGVFAWDYSDTTRWLLLTAKHVVDAANRVLPLQLTGNGQAVPVVKAPVGLWGDKGEPEFMTYRDIDLAVVPVSKSNLRNDRRLVPLVRSRVSWSDEVLNGDPVLMFGSAVNPIFERYEGKSQFLTTSGTVALQTDSTYVVDQSAFPGMSGGLVFKQHLAFRVVEGEDEQKHFPILGYTAIGVVTRNVPELTDRYTQIVKLNYLDSIMVRYTSKGWGTE